MRGHTLLEMVLAAGMLMVLMVTIILVYVVGASAWRKGDTQAELLQDLQTSGARLSVDLASSSYEGLSVGPSFVSCLSPVDKDGKLAYQAGQPLLRWARFRRWALSSSGELLRRDFDVPSSSPVVTAPVPLESFVGGPYAGGSLMMRNMTVFSVTMAGVRTLRVTMTAEKKRYGHRDPEKVSRVFVVRVNN